MVLRDVIAACQPCDLCLVQISVGMVFNVLHASVGLCETRVFDEALSGKTYLACALGMAAVRKFLTVKYIRLPELLTELAIARGNGTYRKVVQQYKKPSLLILDEWLLYPLKETEARDLLEIAEARYKKASTIFCSQFDVPGWRDKIGEPILADAICDRIVHDSYPLVIDCKESMHKRKGVSEI